MQAFGLEDLVQAKLQALVNLDSLGMFKGRDPKPLSTFKKSEITISGGIAAFLPAGSVPVVSASPSVGTLTELEEETKGKSVALFIPLLYGGEALKEKSGDARLLMKQYLDMSLQAGQKEPFLTVARLLKKWAESWAN